MSKTHLIAHYTLNDTLDSKVGELPTWVGESEPEFVEIANRKGLRFPGKGYLKLSQNLLESVNDETGFTFATWIFVEAGQSVWERIFDFGSTEGQPSVFFTRNFRATLSGFGDLVADASKAYKENTWVHLAFVYTPTDKARNSSAGGRVYVDGLLVGDGLINQTTSGLFGQLKRWTQTLDSDNHFTHNYLGHSQYAADPDFKGILSDVMVFNQNLNDHDILSLMAATLEDEAILNIAKQRDLDLGMHIVSDDLDLPKSVFGSLVDVTYTSNNPKVLGHDGKVYPLDKPTHVVLEVTLIKGDASLVTAFDFTVMPKGVAPYEIKIKNEKIADVSEILYGLFYEDINNAADGGIYAELVRNRSFESFEFKDFVPNDNVCGCELGRNHDPLQGWYGDLNRVEIKTEDSLDKHLNLEKGTNSHYIHIEDGTLINKGYNDNTHQKAMLLEKEGQYDLSFWARGNGSLRFKFTNEVEDVGELYTVTVNSNTWTHFEDHTLIALKDGFAQLEIEVVGSLDLDVISLMPQNVWGMDEASNPSSKFNTSINKNYRMRKDLVSALEALNPKFLRFPGGCISEGAFLWDNVFDWKQTMGPIEMRKENFNLWGYSMTMGLGYFEYFQLAEDLNAYPVPVMACGVLCQARSDYAAPAGGALRDYYISNFTDLVDFAISMDFTNNKWAKMRQDLGHPEPFKLKYLGVGNENWGDEFFANFEIFKHEINKHMKKYYPEHELHIISTVGAQADDDAFQEGWKFLHGDHQGVDRMAFTDGHSLFEEDVLWYAHEKHHMDTIADEHYYRNNDYLIQNVDRYDYYKRVYHEGGSLDVTQTSKVFVGEYASTDKNTLRGAISEAALMTGFENNADVVVMASYAPLFNKVLFDNTYRWTPDLIWFDNETHWLTPNYHNQKMFANHIGSHVLETDFTTYEMGRKINRIPSGKVSVAALQADVLLKTLEIVSKDTHEVIFKQDFKDELDAIITQLPGGLSYDKHDEGIVLKNTAVGENGLLVNYDFNNVIVKLDAKRLSERGAILVGVGVKSLSPKTSVEYAIDYLGHTTGLRVFKEGVEGYRLGDFSSSVVAGNMRRSLHEPLLDDEIEIVVDYGLKTMSAHYVEANEVKGFLAVKNRAYHKEVFHTVSEDKDALYIKLVNIDGVDKGVNLDLSEFNIDNIATITVLGGNKDLLDIPNVNGKSNERVVPFVDEITFDHATLKLNLPLYSVSVVKVNKL